MKYQYFYYLFCLFIAYSSVLMGQGNKTDFSLIESSAATQESNFLQSGDKYLKAKQVYEKLIAAKGDYRFPPPPFVISTNEANIAFLQGDGRSIGLEEKAFDVLERFGEDGLAFILGHEVSHFYEKHPYQMEVFQKYNDVQLNKDLKVAIDPAESRADYNKLALAVEKGQKRLTKVTMEMEADYLGGFLAYSAGYNMKNVPELFELLYREYNMSDTVFGYVTKQERMEMARVAEAQMNEFIDVYEVANLLISINRYADARTLYKYILEKYQGREIYNNLGVLTVLEAMEYLSKSEKKYHLPLELDLSFNSASKEVADSTAFRNSLLQEALGYFTSAVSLDASYAPAYLNMACVYYLQKDNTRATFYAETEAKQRAAADQERFPNTSADAEVLLALIDIDAGNESAAAQRLEAISSSSELARLNLATLKGEDPPKTVQEFADYTINWKVDGSEKSDIKVLTQKKSLAKNIDLFNEARLEIWAKENKTIYKFNPAISSKRSKVSFMITNPGYTGQADRRFAVGSQGADIIERFLQPTKRIPTVNGSIWVYDSAIMIMDKEEKLKRWVLFD